MPRTALWARIHAGDWSRLAAAVAVGTVYSPHRRRILGASKVTDAWGARVLVSSWTCTAARHATAGPTDYRGEACRTRKVRDAGPGAQPPGAASTRRGVAAAAGLAILRRRCLAATAAARSVCLATARSLLQRLRSILLHRRYYSREK